MFSFYLSNAAEENLGEVTLGGYNTDRFTGEVIWTPVDKEGYWSFSLDSTTVSVAGGSRGALSNFPVGTPKLTSAIADTGYGTFYNNH